MKGRDAHSMYFLMLPIHSGVFGTCYSSIANNVKVILDIDDSTLMVTRLSFSCFLYKQMEKACGYLLEAGKAYE